MRLLLALPFAAALQLEQPSLSQLAAALVNQSIDDTNPSIVYLPSGSWHASTIPCESCLNPPNASAFLNTWHDGTHIIPNADEDDESGRDPDAPDTDGDAPSTSAAHTSSSSSTSHSSTHSTSSTSSASPAATTAAPAAADDDGDDDGHKGKGGDHPERRRRRRRKPTGSTRRGTLTGRDGGDPFEVPSLDSDDPGFQDISVNMTLNFTGSAIYLYALVPLYASPANNTPTFVNLSFMLDNTPVLTPYLHTGSPLPASLSSLFANTSLTGTGKPGDPLLNPALPKNNASFFAYSTLVFSMTGLSSGDDESAGQEDTEHSLIVNVGPNSVFLFDYALVTTTGNSTNTNTTAATQGVNSANDPMKKHNVATFAGAVGGSAGFLAILALGLALSIYIRRRRSAKRDQHIHQQHGSSQLMGEYTGGGNGNTFVAYAERFSAVDHGADEAAPGTENGMGEGMGPGRLDQEVPDYDERSGRRRRTRNNNNNRTRGSRANSNAPLMSQAQPAPFVPRYFPGTVPASPPPYPTASREGTPLIQAQSQPPDSIALGLPPPPPPPPPAQSQLPPPLLYSSTMANRSGDLTYADMPPPTPPGGFEDDLYEEVPPLGISTRAGATPSDVPSSPTSTTMTRTNPVLGLILAAATANSASSQAASPVLSTVSSTFGNRERDVSAGGGVTTVFGHMTNVNSRAASLRSIGSISSLAGRDSVVGGHGGGSDVGMGTNASEIGDGSGGSTSGSAVAESQDSRTPLIPAGNSSNSATPVPASTPTLTPHMFKRKPPPMFTPDDINNNDNHARTSSTTSLPIMPSINSSSSALQPQLQSRASSKSLKPTPRSEQFVDYVSDDSLPTSSTSSLSPSNSSPSTLTTPTTPLAPSHQVTSSQSQVSPPPLPVRSELRRSESGPRSGHQQ